MSQKRIFVGSIDFFVNEDDELDTDIRLGIYKTPKWGHILTTLALGLNMMPVVMIATSRSIIDGEIVELFDDDGEEDDDGEVPPRTH